MNVSGNIAVLVAMLMLSMPVAAQEESVKPDISQPIPQTPVDAKPADRVAGPLAVSERSDIADMSKMAIELPVERLLVLQPPVADPNPAVSPGLVNWHADFETARAASQESGKPVFLFHLLGQLDQRFT